MSTFKEEAVQTDEVSYTTHTAYKNPKNPSYEGSELMNKNIQLGPLELVEGKEFTYLKMRVDGKGLRIKVHASPLEPAFSVNPYNTQKVQLPVDVSGDPGFEGWNEAWTRAVMSYLNEQCMPETMVEVQSLCKNGRMYIQWPREFNNRLKFKALKTPIGYTQPESGDFHKLNAKLDPTKELEIEIDLLCWLRQIDGGRKIQAGFTAQLFSIDSSLPTSG
jgi:hypothetical protein